MTQREWLRKNRTELDIYIRRALGYPDYRLNDYDRWQWVQNDEGLYLWAKRDGVRV